MHHPFNLQLSAYQVRNNSILVLK